MKIFNFILLLIVSANIYAQTDTSKIRRSDTAIVITDSLQMRVLLPEISVVSSFFNRPFLRLPAALTVIDSISIQRTSNQSPVSLFNNSPGVRMEERSPGSYRLSVRGSLLRSPFGVRNIKVYLDDFPFTDATGNAYINILELNQLERIEILKGPDGSLYGNNSGGIIMLKTIEPATQVYSKAEVSAGSFQHLYSSFTVNLPISKNTLIINGSLRNYGGYRDHSSLSRKHLRIKDRISFNTKSELNIMFLITDLDYLTPGGLTLEQYTEDPRASRPSGITLPGAAEQNAGVSNNTKLLGVSHTYKLNDYLTHFIAISGSFTDYRNPFITNVEEHSEDNRAIRTELQLSNNKKGTIDLNLSIGMEAQESNTLISEYENNKGTKGNMISKGTLTGSYALYFAKISSDFFNRLIIDVSAGVNNNAYDFASILPNATYKKDFGNRVMPRAMISYLVNKTIAIRFSVSRGFSPPSFNEVRTTGNIINFRLKPEYGTSYETGLRLSAIKNRVWWDATIYSYALNEAIIRETDEAGTSFYSNSGKINLQGFESKVILVGEIENNIIETIRLTNALTLNHYIFNNYLTQTVDYSGLRVTGVPKSEISTTLSVDFRKNLYLLIDHHFTSDIPLNDANTIHSIASNPFNLRAGYTLNKGKFIIKAYSGINNAFDKRYSRGFDINAAGGRYYNTAPGREFYIGIEARFK